MPSLGGRELVILDCDGVLVDSEPLLMGVRQQMLAELNVTISTDELIRDFVGTPHAQFVAALERLTGEPLPLGWDAKYQLRCRTAFEARLRPVPGIVAALDDISLPTCVASSGSLEKMTLTLGLTGLLPRFDGRLFSGTDVEKGKPYPDLFLLAASRTAAAIAVGNCDIDSMTTTSGRSSCALGVTPEA
jgi:beta-phosphoglucomutase-like phosphatase (HAD superfamily)